MSAKLFVRNALPTVLGVILSAGLILTSPVQAQTYTVLGILPSTDNPITNISAENVVQGRSGDIYAISLPQGGIVNATTAGGFSQVAQPGGNGLTLGADGNFYIAVAYDRIGCGEVNRITPAGVITQLASVCNTYGNGPETEPIQAPSGIFYGTSSEIPSGGQGTIYSMTSAGALTLLHQFVGTDGTNPIAPMVIAGDGNLYGGTRSGGANNDGVLFRITPGGALTVLHSFTGTDGRDVEHAMILGRDGNLYGVTQSGGPAGYVGVIFKLSTAGVYTVLYNLPSTYSAFNSRLVQATDGKFYGLISQGNSSEPGWIYSVTTAGKFTILHEFCQQTNCTDGIAPSTPMIQHTDGKLYGFTYHGGDTSVCAGDGCGVLYSLDVGLKPFATLVTASGKVGSKIGILGQGFSASSVVKFNGVTATTVSRAGTTFLLAAVPAGASNGSVTVTTGTTTLTSAQKFVVHNSWSTGAGLPTAVQFPVAAALNGKIYVVGGTTATSLVGDNQVYTPGSNTWTTAAAIPAPVYGAASAVVSGVLYVIGGYTTASSTATNLVQAYNPTTNIWTTKTNMPTARGSAAAVLDGGSIYVIGGNGTTQRLNKVEKFNPATDTWTTEAPLLVGKSEPSAAMLGATIVAVDGYTAAQDTGDNEGYTVSTNKWKTLQADPTPRNASCYGTLSGALFIAGGGDNGTPQSLTESFNATADSFTSQAAMPQAVIAPGSTVANGLLYCVGGSSSGVQLEGTVYNNLQIYQP
jgi:uncharacterized repeat protein (TIGR03803 family)